MDKKEQAKSLKQIQDYTDVGDYNKAVKYCNMSKCEFWGRLTSVTFQFIYIRCCVGLTKNLNQQFYKVMKAYCLGKLQKNQEAQEVIQELK